MYHAKGYKPEVIVYSTVGVAHLLSRIELHDQERKLLEYYR